MISRVRPLFIVIIALSAGSAAIAQEAAWESELALSTGGGEYRPGISLVCEGDASCRDLLTKEPGPEQPAQLLQGFGLAGGAMSDGARGPFLLGLKCDGSDSRCDLAIQSVQESIRRGEVEMPVAPGGPVGCKLNPKCFEDFLKATQGAIKEVYGVEGPIAMEGPHGGGGIGNCAGNPLCRVLFTSGDQ